MKVRYVWTRLRKYLAQFPESCGRPHRGESRSRLLHPILRSQFIIVAYVLNHFVAIRRQKFCLSRDHDIFTARLLVRVVDDQDFHFRFTASPKRDFLFCSCTTMEQSTSGDAANSRKAPLPSTCRLPEHHRPSASAMRDRIPNAYFGKCVGCRARRDREHKPQTATSARCLARPGSAHHHRRDRGRDHPACSELDREPRAAARPGMQQTK
jgi:hypothetical protein